MKTKRVLFTAGITLGILTAQAAHLDEYDRQIVATCMVLEAGGDGAEGMQGVLNVMLTRAMAFYISSFRKRLNAEPSPACRRSGTSQHPTTAC